jgi:hypothetical protein
MFHLTKAQVIDYIKKNDDCLGDCDTCLLSTSELREIGVDPIPDFCSDRFLLFVRKISPSKALDIVRDRKIVESCKGRQNFLFELVKKSSKSKLLPNEN